MRELQVTQQSPRSHIVVQCHRCHRSWYIDPGRDHEDAGLILTDAVEHDCQEKK